MISLKQEMKVTIGLEVHCQLTNLKTKLFCPCPADYRGKEPNTNICPVCMGLPGTLPVLNERAVEGAVKAALALRARLSRRMLFFRKNYYYPDMPKNFQISQYDRAGGIPLAVDGEVDLGEGRKIRIRRLQLEEDPGKLSYEGSITSSPYTLVDYNRAGIALLEVVSEPDIESPREARRYLEKLRSILEHIEVFDGSLEGSMRCDANISLHGGSRVEIKNITSFKEVERALNFEITRQKARLGRGIKVAMETRHWDDVRRVTVSLRIKEEEQDYRYFPEPDLVPVTLSEEYIEKIRRQMPELPDARKDRFRREYGISAQNAEILTNMKGLADLFEEAAAFSTNPKRVSNWIVGEIVGYMNRKNVEVKELKIEPKDLAELADLVEEGTISDNTGRSILLQVLDSGVMPKVSVVKKKLARISDRSYVEELVENIFEKSPEAFRDALKNEKAINYIIGQVMKASDGKADPKITRQIIYKKIGEVQRA